MSGSAGATSDCRSAYETPPSASTANVSPGCWRSSSRLEVVPEPGRAYASSVAGRVVGRDDELRKLDAFLELVAQGSAAFVVEGEPGIGKSTLWDAGVGRATESGLRVMSCRSAPSV